MLVTDDMRSFLTAIRAEPSDRLTYGAFADWLDDRDDRDDRDDPDRAAAVRDAVFPEQVFALFPLSVMKLESLPALETEPDPLSTRVVRLQLTDGCGLPSVRIAGRCQVMRAGAFVEHATDSTVRLRRAGTPLDVTWFNLQSRGVMEWVGDGAPLYFPDGIDVYADAPVTMTLWLNPLPDTVP